MFFGLSGRFDINDIPVNGLHAEMRETGLFDRGSGLVTDRLSAAEERGEEGRCKEGKNVVQSLLLLSVEI